MYWPLYHGTTSSRLKRILEENRLRVSDPGEPVVCMSTEYSVAEYFACCATSSDRDSGWTEARPVVMMLDGLELLGRGYNLIYPEEIPRFAWENEVSCKSDIKPLNEVLCDVTSVPARRVQDWLDTGRKAFDTGTPPTAPYILDIVFDIHSRLAEGKISARTATARMRFVRRMQFAARGLIGAGGSVARPQWFSARLEPGSECCSVSALLARSPEPWALTYGRSLKARSSSVGADGHSSPTDAC
jgi:hypothetical protein